VVVAVVEGYPTARVGWVFGVGRWGVLLLLLLLLQAGEAGKKAGEGEGGGDEEGCEDRGEGEG
jgi:hypothetical protein